MDIPSYTSNIQSYGAPSGTNIAFDKSGNVPSISTSQEGRPVANSLAPQPESSVDSTVKAAQARQEINREERLKIVEQMNEFISSINKGLSFRVDEASGRDVVTIYEANTGDVIRQIPDEEMLEILRRLAAQSANSGLLVDKV